METKLAGYIAKLHALAGPYFNQKKILHTTRQCCFRFTGNTLMLLLVNHTSNAIEILAHDEILYDHISHLTIILKSWAEKHSINNVPIYWLLNPEDYQLFMIESLPVPENEIKSALNWRIRSLISYPIEDAMIDYFMLPPKKTSPESPLIAAVAANINKLLDTMDLFKKAGLKLKSIYLPELALRNVAALHETDEKSTAMLYFYDKTILLTISRKKTLYFTRQLPWQMTGTTEMDFEKLSLEIVRYFDYYQSQWRYPAPSRIYVASDSSRQDHLISKISAHLLVPVTPYTLPDTISIRKEDTLMQSGYLLNYGCAINRDELNA